jgi:hypothetical protein
MYGYAYIPYIEFQWSLTNGVCKRSVTTLHEVGFVVDQHYLKSELPDNCEVV